MNINLVPLLPEIFMVIMIILMLLIDAFSTENTKSVDFVLTLITLAVAFIIQMAGASNHQTEVLFNGLFLLDPLAYGSKLMIYVFGLVTILYVKKYIDNKSIIPSEFYAIFLFAILGMMVMVSTNNLLVLYVGLELLSLALYGMVALNRDSIKSTEAAMKFFILGALASGLLLFGISFIYGGTGGNLDLQNVFHYLYTSGGHNSTLLVFGLVFIVAGLMFKLGIVPFHMWVPDVYEGAYLPTVTLIATVTKIASVVFVIRFLYSGLDILSEQWVSMLMLLGILSLFIGNVVAIAQTNIKRMLGYSAVANLSFVVFGLLSISVDGQGLASAMFYIVSYVITSLAGFAVLMLLSHNNYECESISDLKGLARHHPVYAGIMLFVMLSLAGIPPFVGFYAKFRILEILVNAGYIKLAIYAVVMALIGAFYYLRIIKVMYFDAPELELRITNIGALPKLVLGINALLIIVLGVAPNYLLDFCTQLITN